MSETVRAVTHIHTRKSWDGIIRPDALVDHLEDAGIGLALVTDHDSFDGARAVAEVAADRNLEIQIPVAAEIRTDLGDLVVVLDEAEPPRIEDLKHWRDLISTVRDLGGIVWFPHPFRGHDNPQALAEHSDVIEMFNSRCSS